MVKRRNLVFVAVVFPLTLGIYGLYWFYSTAEELIKTNKQEDNSLLWLLMALIPIVNLFAIWKHAQAVGTMTSNMKGENGINPILLFFLWLAVNPVAVLWTQSKLNKLAS